MTWTILLSLVLLPTATSRSNDWRTTDGGSGTTGASGMSDPKYCLGSEGRDGAGGATPAGVLHAVVISDAFEGIAICGQRIIAWPGKPVGFIEGQPACRVCHNLVTGYG